MCIRDSIQDSLILVTNSFSTMTSYENQTKKAINNKFIQEAMTDFIKQRLEIYFIENKTEADKICLLYTSHEELMAEKGLYYSLVQSGITP